MNWKTLLLAFILGLLSLELYSQVSVTGYSVYALGVNTSTDKRISGEMKIFANRDINDVIFELDAFYNFKPRTYHRFSLGAGIATAPREFYGITVPVVLEVYPLKDFKKISLLFEISPELLQDYLNVRSLFGVRYSFGDIE